MRSFDHGRKLIVATLFIISALVITGCHSKSAKKSDEDIQGETASQEVVIYPVERSPKIPFARANITFPGQDEILEDDDVFVVIEVENFQLGAQTNTLRARELSNSPKGQHVHLIVDNKPYIAVYTQGEPINVGKLGPGTHTVVVFPSRSYHESVKSPEAYDIKNFNVISPSGVALNRGTPSIIYSRPKGTYKGVDAAEIMLDFYLNDVELSEGGNFARYTIVKKDGSQLTDEIYSIDIHEWKPAFVRGLKTGVYQITLELLDNDGNQVAGPWNKTTREIEVISE